MYLNCKTYFSFRYGTFSTRELVETAVDNGLPALALTNINTTCDTWEFVKLCREKEIKPIAGVEIRNGDKLLYILLAANLKGFTWINTFLSEHLINKKPFPEVVDNLVLFPDPSEGFVIYPLNSKPLEQLKNHERIGVLPWEVNKLFSIEVKNYVDKLVVLQPVTFQNKTYFNLHRLLRAINNNCLLSKLPVEAQASEKEVFNSPDYILKSFKDHSSIVTNTYRLMESCTITMDFETDKNMKCYSATKEDDRILLSKLAGDGFQRRYHKKNKIALDRLMLVKFSLYI